MTVKQRKLLFSFLVAALFLIPMLHLIDLSAFLERLRRIDANGLVVAFLILAAANFVRSFRFERLDDGGISLSNWWIINGFYNAITATFPGGVGEAVTAFAMKKTVRDEFLLSFRILILSRVMDLGCISLMLFFTAISMSGAWRGITLGVALFFLFVSAVLLVPATERLVLRIAGRVFRKGGRFTARLLTELEGLAAAVEQKRDIPSYVVALACSLLVIGCSALSVHEVVRSIGIDFSWVQSFYCFGVYALFQLVPLQGFAGIGTQAAWWALALGAAGYGGKDTLGLGAILYGTFYIFIFVLCLSVILYWYIRKMARNGRS